MSSVARHAEIAEKYRAAIKNGRLTKGERLPIQPEMAQEHGVATVTIHRAMSQLKAEGLIHTSHNGTYVGPRPEWPEMQEARSARCHTRTCRNTLEISSRISVYDLLKMTGWIYRGTQLGRVYYCHGCAPKVEARERGAEG